MGAGVEGTADLDLLFVGVGSIVVYAHGVEGRIAAGHRGHLVRARLHQRLAFVCLCGNLGNGAFVNLEQTGTMFKGTVLREYKPMVAPVVPMICGYRGWV